MYTKILITAIILVGLYFLWRPKKVIVQTDNMKKSLSLSTSQKRVPITSISHSDNAKHTLEESVCLTGGSGFIKMKKSKPINPEDVDTTDQHGNSLKIVDKKDFYPKTSRFVEGYSFYDMEGKVTLLNYHEVLGTFASMNPHEWEILAEPYGRPPYKGRMTEKTVLESVGMWITNNMTGVTYEYLDEWPAGVSRPMNLEEGLR